MGVDPVRIHRLLTDVISLLVKVQKVTPLNLEKAKKLQKRCEAARADLDMP